MGLVQTTRYMLSLLAYLVVSIVCTTQSFADCESQASTKSLYPVGWGIDHGSQRFQDATDINTGNTHNLRLKWAYGFGTDTPRVFPLVSEDTIFIGDGGVGLVALNRESGCIRWVNEAVVDPSTAISHGELDGEAVLVIAGRQSGVFAVNAKSGATIWHREITQDNPVPLYSGSPLVFEEQVFVPLSSAEIGLSISPFYGCCTTSGAMASLDLRTGDTLWYRRTIPTQPQVTGQHYLLVDEHGPSGAPVWSAPTLDVARRVLYFGTGQNYSHPTTATSDAIFAVNIDTGEPKWIAQFTKNDAFNMACTMGTINCPDPMGPDVDFGAPPILVTLADGNDLVLAGQKSGDVWALDPHTGEVKWHNRIGRGGALGGIHWGMAFDPQSQTLLVPVSDVEALPGPDEAEPGIFGLDVLTGERKWSAPRVQSCDEQTCWSGLSAAITAAPGLVVTGGLDGALEIYRTDTGGLIWSYDSLREFDAVNGVPTRGGAIDAHGPLLVGNMAHLEKYLAMRC